MNSRPNMLSLLYTFTTQVWPLNDLNREQHASAINIRYLHLTMNLKAAQAGH